MDLHGAEVAVSPSFRLHLISSSIQHHPASLEPLRTRDLDGDFSTGVFATKHQSWSTSPNGWFVDPQPRSWIASNCKHQQWHTFPVRSWLGEVDPARRSLGNSIIILLDICNLLLAGLKKRKNDVTEVSMSVGNIWKAAHGDCNISIFVQYCLTGVQWWQDCGANLVSKIWKIMSSLELLIDCLEPQHGLFIFIVYQPPNGLYHICTMEGKTSWRNQSKSAPQSEGISKCRFNAYNKQTQRTSIDIPRYPELDTIMPTSIDNHASVMIYHVIQ